MEIQEEVKKKIKGGWIQTVMLVEVLAVNEEAAKSALENHVEKMSKEKKTFIGRKDFKGIKKIENPAPNIPVAYSYVVELEVLTESFETLIYLAMNYGPSSIELLHPKKVVLDMGEAQGILVSVADMLHKFARVGTGGMLISS